MAPETPAPKDADPPALASRYVKTNRYPEI